MLSGNDIKQSLLLFSNSAAVAAAKSLQSCPTLCDPIGGSPPGSVIPGILQARILEWVAISFSVVSNSFKTPWTEACQASLSFTICLSLLKLRSIESVMSSNHLVLCCPLLLLPSIFPSIRVFSNELALHIRWPKYWSFSFSINLAVPLSLTH